MDAAGNVPRLPLQGHLDDAQRAALAALAQPLLAGAPPSVETLAQLAARCDARLAALPSHTIAELGTALTLLSSRVGVLLAGGRPVPFAALALPEQQRCLRVWTTSPLAPVRAAVQAVRRLVYAMYYADPTVTAAIGYDGPLQTRAPQVAWEGPLDGTPNGADPVARGPLALPTVIAPDPLPTGVIPGAAVAQDLHRTADVVVIGTGAGGAVAAARLAEAGYQVVVLEAGAYHTRSDFTEDEPTLNAALYADGGLRATDDQSIAMLQGETVGGSTTVNWMIMLRTPAYVLDEWARRHGVYGMDAAQMAPVFARVEQEVHARDVTDDAHSPNNRLILDGARQLGWRASSARINAVGCVRCGFCGLGCRHNAKQSTLLTYLPRALAAGATLFADARVTRIERRERDTGTGTPALKRVHASVQSRTPGAPARTLTIDAPLVVLAGGAVGTPVLLQQSGLGGGGVGQWLRLHPTTALMGRYDRDIVTSTGIPLSSMCDEFIRWNGTDYGFWIETPPMHPSFTAAAMPGVGAEHAERMRAFRSLGVLIALTRDGADVTQSNGRVSVTRRGRVSIRYRLGTADAQRVRASLVAAAQLHLANGAREVLSLHAPPVSVRSARDLDALAAAPLSPHRLALFSAHVNGTCRMGTDPATSGATPDGERHGVRGLYIMDGSLLPTALGVNPQETIMAVTSVLTERVAARHAGLQMV